MKYCILFACSITGLVFAESSLEVSIRVPIVLAVLLSEIIVFKLKFNQSYAELFQTAALLMVLDDRPVQSILILMMSRFLSDTGKTQLVILAIIVLANWIRNYVIEQETEEIFIGIIEILSVCSLIKLNKKPLF